MESQGEETMNLAQEFVEYKGPKIHRALEVKTHFNVLTSTYELKEIQ